MADGTEEFDFVLEDAPFEHLLEVDSFGTGTGDDEADVWVEGEDPRDGGYEEVGAFVVEEARDHYNCYGGMGAERGARRWRWGQ